LQPADGRFCPAFWTHLKTPLDILAG
jgi:hypothetical protein